LLRLQNPDIDIITQAEAYDKDIIDRGVFRNVSSGGFFLSKGRAQHLLGPEYPLNSIALPEYASDHWSSRSLL